MMYYKNQVPNLFYELKYDFTVYDQFFYDALVTTMLPCTIYSHTIFPAPTELSIRFVVVSIQHLKILVKTCFNIV
jgi:hypothetical protein